MTKDELKTLWEARQQAEKAVNAMRGRPDTFEDDLAYQTTSLKYAKAVNRYEDAVREFVKEQEA